LTFARMRIIMVYVSNRLASWYSVDRYPKVLWRLEDYKAAITHSWLPLSRR
jgi:hypothetical protein